MSTMICHFVSPPQVSYHKVFGGWLGRGRLCFTLRCRAINGVHAMVDTGIETRRKSHSLGEQLEGHELRNSGYELFFTQVVPTWHPTYLIIHARRNMEANH